MRDCVIDDRHFSISEKNIVFCDDVSFGQESVPITCLVDENLLNAAEETDGQMIDFSLPWETFTYVTRPLHDQSLAFETESFQLGCACTYSTCSFETCDHVYLFNNDYEDAKDIYGKPMRGRFPYDDRGWIILEEGYHIEWSLEKFSAMSIFLCCLAAISHLCFIQDQNLLLVLLLI